MLFRKQTLLGLWRHVFIPLVPVSILVIATVLAGRDLGTAMILVLIVLGALFFSGVKLRIFILPAIVAARRRRRASRSRAPTACAAS